HLAWAALLLVTCAPGRDTDPGADPTPGEGGGGGTGSLQCTARGAIKCDNDGSVLTCDGSTYRDKTACAAPRTCIDAVGCVECRPDGQVCVGDAVHQCNSDGTIGSQLLTCNEGQCKEGQCADGCGGAATNLIYVVDETYRLLSFDPMLYTFKLIGRLNCP